MACISPGEWWDCVSGNQTGEKNMVAAVQTKKVFSIRRRSTGQFAVMRGSLDVEPGTLIFESRDQAENFHRTVIGSKSINRRKRTAALKDWNVVEVPRLIPEQRYCLATANRSGNGHNLILFNL